MAAQGKEQQTRNKAHNHKMWDTAAQGKEYPTQNKAHNPKIWVSWSAGHGTANGRKRLQRMPFTGT
jgi:hypothetical protein